MSKGTGNHSRTIGGLGGLVTGLAAVAAIHAASANPEPNLPGPFDLTAKLYVSEIISGASEGMRDKGWENEALEHRISVMESWRPEAFRAPFEEVHERAYQQALDGLWTEHALESYLRVIETPLAELQVLARHIPTVPRDDFEEGVRAVMTIEAAALSFDYDDAGDSPIIQAAYDHGFLVNGPMRQADPASGRHLMAEVQTTTFESLPEAWGHPDPGSEPDME